MIKPEFDQSKSETPQTTVKRSKKELLIINQNNNIHKLKHKKKKVLATMGQ